MRLGRCRKVVLCDSTPGRRQAVRKRSFWGPGGENGTFQRSVCRAPQRPPHAANTSRACANTVRLTICRCGHLLLGLEWRPDCLPTRMAVTQFACQLDDLKRALDIVLTGSSTSGSHPDCAQWRAAGRLLASLSDPHLARTFVYDPRLRGYASSLLSSSRRVR